MNWNIQDIRNPFLKLQSYIGLHYVVLTISKTSHEKLTVKNHTNYGWHAATYKALKRIDSKEELYGLNWTIYNGRRKECVIFKTDTENHNIVWYCYWNNFYLKNNGIDLNLK